MISNKVKMHIGSGNDEALRLAYLIKEDSSEVMALLRNYFIPFEPICQGLGARAQDKKELHESIVRQSINCGLSLGARTREGKLVGVSLVDIDRKEELVERDDDESPTFEATNDIVRHTLEVINHMTDNYDVLQRQEVNEALYYSMVCVHPDCRGQNINGKMTEYLEQKARERGIRVVYSICTGFRSQASFQKIGYETAFENPYKNFDFLDLTAMGENKSIKLMVKRLN